MIFGMTKARFGLLVFALLAVANIGLFTWNQVDAAAIQDMENQIVALRRGAATTAGAAAGVPPSDNPVELRRQLADIEGALAMAGAAFPLRVDPLALQDQAVRAAARAGVSMTSVVLQAEGNKAIAGGSFPARGLTIQARGADLGAVLAFVAHMQQTIYETSVIEGLKIGEAELGGWTADFNLVVYQRQVGGGQ